MSDFFNDDVRKSLERMSNIHNKFADSILQRYKYFNPPSIHPGLQSIHNEVTNSLIQYQNVLDNSIQASLSNDHLSRITNAAIQNQVVYLQHTIDAIHLKIPNFELLGIQQLSETVDILSNHFQRYSILDAIDFPTDIENELHQAIEKTKTLDIEKDNNKVEYELIDDKSINFISRLTLLLSILSVFLTAHGNILQMQANELQREANRIEEEKVKVLESIDGNLEEINKYLSEYNDLPDNNLELD